MDYYENIKKELIELDIGLLIVNAGIYRPGDFTQINTDVQESMLDANVYHVAAFVKKFLPGLIGRS